MGLFDKFRKPKFRKEKVKKPAAPSGEPRSKREVKKEIKSEDEKKPPVISAKKKKIKEEKKEKVAAEPAKKAKKIKYKEAYRVLIRPVVSEKATYLTSQNSYVFEVSPRMNKIEVKKAIISVYGVEPIKVNMINVLGRNVRYGKVSGRTKSWKKAIVTLKPGETIKIYEGV